MSTIRAVSFPAHGEPSVKLTGYLITPSARKSEVVCVFAHPWGFLGGSQGNTEPYARILASEYGYTCLIFNMRGVQESSGSASFTGTREVADVIGACEWVKGELGRPVVLVGSSAGAAIAGSALDRVQEAVGYVGIGYTFGWASSWVLGSHYEAIMRSEKPKLFILGTKDGFTSVNQLNQRVTMMKNASAKLIDDVGHFSLETPQYAKVTSELIAEFLTSFK